MKTINKINHLRMQIAAIRSKIYANPQPAATTDLTSKEVAGLILFDRLSHRSEKWVYAIRRSKAYFATEQLHSYRLVANSGDTIVEL